MASPTEKSENERITDKPENGPKERRSSNGPTETDVHNELNMNEEENGPIKSQVQNELELIKTEKVEARKEQNNKENSVNQSYKIMDTTDVSLPPRQDDGFVPVKGSSSVIESIDKSSGVSPSKDKNETLETVVSPYNLKTPTNPFKKKSNGVFSWRNSLIGNDTKKSSFEKSESSDKCEKPKNVGLAVLKVRI